jgi:DNA-binding CsgD family transcriptional regulator
MTVDRLSIKADSAANAKFERHERCRSFASYEGELTRIQLRDALAREAVLLRQMDELIRKLSAWRETATNHVAGLTPRERHVMERILAGHPNKNIAADLGISQRTVESHRASIMRKTGSKSLPALARLALAAARNDADEPVIQGRSPVAAARRAAGR